jgi:hypothetical protein
MYLDFRIDIAQLFLIGNDVTGRMDKAGFEILAKT